jgi:4-diphosphocytidyl-2-C-methyl-D-erythritol kinase
MTLTERAPAKVNLCLFVGPVRESDGRHKLVSVMQSLTLADEVQLTPAPAGASGDVVVCPGVDGPNLAGAALSAFRRATGWDAPPQQLTIAKRVPVAAGMGGGSGDAAAALRLAARAAGVDDDALLLGIAADLGADVPAQVRPGRALATGAGEVVRRLPDGPPLGVLVLPQDRPLSTADVYREVDARGAARDAAALAEALAAVESALPAVPPGLMVNDLAPAARALEPAIAGAEREAAAAGADHVLVSGSGPTVLGLFAGDDGPKRARRAAATRAGRAPAAIVCEALRT